MATVIRHRKIRRSANYLPRANLSTSIRLVTHYKTGLDIEYEPIDEDIQNPCKVCDMVHEGVTSMVQCSKCSKCRVKSS